MSTIWAVTDFTKENGATQIVPGSHLWEKDRIPNEDEIAYAEMEAGSVLLYTGTVLHGGGENTSKNDIRTGVFLHMLLIGFAKKKISIYPVLLRLQKIFRLK